MTARGGFRTLGLVLALAAAAGCGDDGTSPDGTDPGPDDPPPPDTASWSALEASPAASDGRHDDVFFLDEALGWVVNGRGEIHRTEDGGETWSLVHRDDEVLFRAVGFASAELGWAGNLNLTSSPRPGVALFQTTDGGDTWRNVTERIDGPEPVGLCGIWVVDEERVYAVGRWNGPAVFLRTEDGGESWTSSSLAPRMTGAVDVHFFDRDRGLVVGGRGVGPSKEEQDASRTVILATEDGGRSWEERYVSDLEGTWAWKISFPEPDVGYVAVQGPAPEGRVLKTEDGGRSWRALTVADSVGFSGIGFATTERGWVTGGKDYRTTDGGETWEEVVVGERINRFRFLRPDLGFAAGRRVYVYRP